MATHPKVKCPLKVTAIPNNLTAMRLKVKCLPKATLKHLTATRPKVKICKDKCLLKGIPKHPTAMHPKGKCLLKVTLNNLMVMPPKAHPLLLP
jgi:hypothetical protein